MLVITILFFIFKTALFSFQGKPGGQGSRGRSGRRGDMVLNYKRLVFCMIN